MQKQEIGTLGRYMIGAMLTLSLGSSALMAEAFTIGGETDNLTIALNPANGAVDGVAGSTVGWGFTVNWQATGNYLSFTGTSLGSLSAPETNCSIMAGYTGPACPPGGYTDFISAQGGPSDFSMAPDTIWTEAFDGVSNGVGAYSISSDPTLALAGAEDTGQVTFDFEVYSGDPTLDGVTDYGGYSYYGPSTDFSVTVDAPLQESTPEPDTWVLLCTGLSLLGWPRLRGFKLVRHPK